MSKNYKNPARYRLDFIKENTFNRVWSLRMTRTKVTLVTAAVVAGGAALLWVIMAYTPMRTLLPGSLRGDLRAQYLEMALRLDSLEQKARINDAYLAGIVAVVTDSLPEDSAMRRAAETIIASDSLLASTEAERRFVQSYQEEERFNLSVLAPIAAEGMIFGRPVAAASQAVLSTESVPALIISAGRSVPVTAVYRGTVVGVSVNTDGRYTVMIQHPNDFVSVYSGIGEVLTQKGRKLAGGQSIGLTAAKGNIAFELWHNGTALDPGMYVPAQ